MAPDAPSTLSSSAVPSADSFTAPSSPPPSSAAATATAIPALIAGRTISPEALVEWKQWLAANQKGEAETMDVVPQAVRRVLEEKPAGDALPPPSYLDAYLGSPSTPEQVLEYYCHNGYLSSQVAENEKLRNDRTIAAVDDICELGRQFFDDDVSLVTTVVADTETFLCGMSRCEADNTDWAAALAILPRNACMCRLALQADSDKPFVVADTEMDWRVRNSPLFSAASGRIRYYVSIRVSLPYAGDSAELSSTMVPIGNLCAFSFNPHLVTTQRQLDVMQKLARRVERELLLVYEERRRAKAHNQAQFISSFLRSTLGGSAETVSQLSPGMEAVTNGKQRSDAAFSLVAERVCALSGGAAKSCALLDLRSFFPAKSSTSGEKKTERERRRGRPRVYYHADDPNGLHRLYEGGNPLVVLGEYGLSKEGLERVRTLTSEDLDVFEALVRRLKKGASPPSIDGTILANLVSPAGKATINRLIPVFDHSNSLALLMILSIDKRLDAAGDAVWYDNIAHVCLSVLTKDQDVENERQRLAFLSTLSHALRSPVGALSIQLELLQGHGLDQQLQVASACVESVKTIMDDAVDFFSLQGKLGALSSTSTPDIIDLPTLLAEVTTSALNRTLQVEGSRDSLAQKDVKVIVDAPAREQGWLARVSAPDLRRIYGNVITNAWLYTEKGEVRIVLHPVEPSSTGEPSSVRVDICDTGVGISDEFLQSGGLFLPFRRAEAYKSGAGLGLPIVASLVAAYDGQISVKSAVGQGTTVSISLPLNLIPTHPAGPLLRSLSEEIGTVARALETAALEQTSPATLPSLSPSSLPCSPAPPLSLAETVGSPSPSATPVSPAPRGRSLRAFVCEDNAVARNLLCALLRKQGAEVLAACDGQEGVELFEEGAFRPDITIMDIGMPRKDGIDASFDIRAIEARCGWPRHKIIAFTALSNEADKAKAIGGPGGGPIDAWFLKGGSSLKNLTAELSRMQLELDQTNPPDVLPFIPATSP
ncbi:hypothetical protein JCM8547_000391 [Rhodosporidiobolus lusitaniae]